MVPPPDLTIAATPDRLDLAVIGIEVLAGTEGHLSPELPDRMIMRMDERRHQASRRSWPPAP